MFDDDDHEIMHKHALCWQVDLEDDVNHEYKMAFGYLRGEATTAIFQTVTTLEGVEAKPFPVAFIPLDALREAVSPRWWEYDFDPMDAFFPWIDDES